MQGPGCLSVLTVCSVVLLLFLWAPAALGHGRLIEPPSRASMWRYGFKTPPDYNDHESFCGGFTRQWVKNKGKCGVCGDAWDMPQPRPHETGGTYGQGVTVRRYKQGAAFTIRVEVTANHYGHFEFRLCKKNLPKEIATQHCFNKHVLRRSKLTTASSQDTHPTWFYLGKESKVYEMRYLLPANVICSHCVLQWRYIAANNWGKCSNGSGAIGCGPQEEFRACADIAIEDKNGVDTLPIPMGDDTSYKEVEGTEYYDLNEIENYQTSSEQEDWLLLSLIILFTTMFLTIFFLVLLFVFYYGANKTIKPCWQSTIHGMVRTNRSSKVDMVPPVIPPRTKKTTMPNQEAVASIT